MTGRSARREILLSRETLLGLVAVLVLAGVCVLLGLVLLVPPLFRRRLYRWQGGVCLGLYLLYLAAVLLAPRAGA